LMTTSASSRASAWSTQCSKNPGDTDDAFMAHMWAEAGLPSIKASKKALF
jgi:hypothetical protein